MKKIISLFLVIGLIFSLASCRKPDENKSLYDVYENLSEHGDSGVSDISLSLKIVDKNGELAEDDDAAVFLEPFKSGKNAYELFVGISGAYDSDSQKLSVSLGKDLKSKNDIFEFIKVDGNTYLNLKITYSFIYDLLKSADASGKSGMELPKWKDLGLDGDYLDLAVLAEAFSDIFGLEEKLDISDLLGLLIGGFGSYDDDYYYDDDYGYEFDGVSFDGSEDDYELDFSYYYGEDEFDSEYYPEAEAKMASGSLFGMLFMLFADGSEWLNDVAEAVPQENIKALMDAFESGLKNAGAISNDGGWYVITLDKNVKNIPKKLAKSLEGNVAGNFKAILDAVSDVDSIPDEIKTAFSDLDGLTLDDCEEFEDDLIRELEDADLSDNPFADGDMKIKASVKADGKSSAFKLSVDADVEEASLSASLSAQSSSESVKIKAPDSLISKASVQDILYGLFAYDDSGYAA